MNTISPALAAATPSSQAAPRWTVSAVEALYNMPLMDLLARAHQVHSENFDPNAVQRSTLLSIKTGGCSEDCGYCSQSSRYDTGLEKEALLPLDEVLENARAAKAKGASRFCMGAAWRGPKEKDLTPVLDMVREVKKLGLETCVTLGMLKDGQAEKLKEAGLDYYNHNLDTDAEFYDQVITTHTHADRVDTIAQVRQAGIKVCSGGILGLGESRRNRAAMIAQLANLNPAPDSVPINNLVAIPGTLPEPVLALASQLSDKAAVPDCVPVPTLMVARLLLWLALPAVWLMPSSPWLPAKALPWMTARASGCAASGLAAGVFWT